MEVIYVRGGKGCGTHDRTGLTPEEYVWRYGHPRSSRIGATLTVFDYVEGRLKQWTNWNGSLPPQASGAGLKPTSVQNIATESRIRPTGQDSCIPASCASVLSLYDHVKSVGRDAPGTIQELHFFTHGWHGGPILIDTDEDDSFAVNPARRDPCDGDPRLKDFDMPEVLGGQSGVLFKKAFASGALIKLWGCTHEPEHRDKIIAYLSTRNQKERAVLLRAYLTYLRDSTYQFRLQKLLGIPVYAAPLGYGTDPNLPVGIDGKAAFASRAEYRGIWPPRRGDRWWRVSPFFRPDGAYKFYQSVLGAQTDAVDYVAYTDALVRRLGGP